MAISISLEKIPFRMSDAVYECLCLIGGSLFLALMSQLSIQLWFTPVPITLQTLAVMLLGARLGSKRGSLCVLLYLTEGALGMPVFAQGSSGVAILFGPTGGYLFAFPISAFLIGYLFEKGWKESRVSRVAALSLGTVVILGCGALWLGLYVGTKNALIMGVYPFLVGGMLKVAVASMFVSHNEKSTHLS